MVGICAMLLNLYGVGPPPARPAIRIAFRTVVGYTHSRCALERYHARIQRNGASLHAAAAGIGMLMGGGMGSGVVAAFQAASEAMSLASCTAALCASTMSAAFSASMITGAHVCPPMICGIADASTTRSAPTPLTRSSGSSTAAGSPSEPMRHELVKAFAEWTELRMYESISSSELTAVLG